MASERPFVVGRGVALAAKWRVRTAEARVRSRELAEAALAATNDSEAPRFDDAGDDRRADDGRLVLGSMF